jgi:hypothetical protein
LKNNLYAAFYLNFTSYVGRDGLEQLAQASLSSSSHIKIAQVNPNGVVCKMRNEIIFILPKDL